MSASIRDPATEARAAREDVIRSMATGDWARAAEKLDLAQAAYRDALEGDPDQEIRERLEEEQALCEVHRADLAIRYWRIGEAEACLDRAYAVLKKGHVEAELWRVTARIAERRGRFSSARAAWRKAAKLAAGSHEGVVADAKLRLAEIALLEGNPERSAELIEEVRQMGLDEVMLRIRGQVLEADAVALQGDFDGALEMYRDVARDLIDIPQDFVAIINLRRSGVEVHRAPSAALGRLTRASSLLHRVKHPDGLGMAYGQLAVLAMALKRPIVGALAAVGANASRSGDTVALPLVEAAMDRAEMPVDLEGLEDVQLQEALVGHLASHARQLGIAWSELGTAKGLEKLLVPLQSVSAAGVRVDVESGQIVRSADLVGHRSTLTWDAPLGVLKTIVLVKPALKPRPRPALYQPPPAPPAGIPATPPPVPPRQLGASRNREIQLIYAVTAVGVLAFGGLLGLAMSAFYVSNMEPPVETTDEPVVVPEPAPVIEKLPESFQIEGVVLTEDTGVPVSFTSLSASGTVVLEGQGTIITWTGGRGQGFLAPGVYAVRGDAFEDSTITVEEGAKRCRVRWVGEVIVEKCDR